MYYHGIKKGVDVVMAKKGGMESNSGRTEHSMMTMEKENNGWKFYDKSLLYLVCDWSCR